ncbi:serine/threonine protein kinase [Anncaliia algerae PRA339]|uniref:non-specific serine/threonine protein kinase n=1 Tax=Anncaliia algerae PRA339 TaxID=1288291 RepID=A0A059EW44_9MICR|nr:serine/threonine protein kinase [Anncaliia algerae PRA339]
MNKLKEVFSNFEVISNIGYGSSGQIYLLKHKKEKGFCALKEQFLQRKDDLDSVNSELMVIGLRHRNIIEYVSLGASTRPKELLKIVKTSNEFSEGSGLDRNIIAKNGILIETSSSPNQQQSQETTATYQTATKEIEDIEQSLLKCVSTDESQVMHERNCIDFIEDQILTKIEQLPKKILHEKKINTKNKQKKKCSKKKYYYYSISKYYDFTLRDYVDLRNKEFFGDHVDGCICLSSQPFQCIIPFTGCQGVERIIPADFMVHSFSCKDKLNKSFINFLMKNVVMGIKYLHSKGLVHGDISLSNIFVGNKNDFIPKIGDYGETKSIKEADRMEDIYKIGLLWFELLFPIKTVSERYYLIKEIEKTKTLPDEFKVMYEKEAKLIELCLKKKGKIGLKEILKFIRESKNDCT